MFTGFFAALPDVAEALKVLEAACTQWPRCRARTTEAPYRGIAVSAPEWDMTSAGAGIYAWHTWPDRMLAELPEWSRKFPHLRFVIISWDLDWDDMAYRGYVCREGCITLRADGDRVVEWVAELGVQLGPHRWFPQLSNEFYR